MFFLGFRDCCQSHPFEQSNSFCREAYKRKATDGERMHFDNYSAGSSSSKDTHFDADQGEEQKQDTGTVLYYSSYDDRSFVLCTSVLPCCCV